MKRLRLGLWACFCFCAATTLMGQNKVKTTAEKVMLFIDGAQVTRTKQVDIPAGNSTLIFTGLSPNRETAERTKCRAWTYQCRI